jgi:hypothetical protein
MPTPMLLSSKFTVCSVERSSFCSPFFFPTEVTYDWYAPNVLVNPYHGEDIWEILPINYYQILFNYVFRLEASAQKIVDDFKRDHFGEFTIGIQVRTPTYTKKGEKDHKGFPVPPIDLYAQMAEVLPQNEPSFLFIVILTREKKKKHN